MSHGCRKRRVMLMSLIPYFLGFLGYRIVSILDRCVQYSLVFRLHLCQLYKRDDELDIPRLCGELLHRNVYSAETRCALVLQRAFEM